MFKKLIYEVRELLEGGGSRRTKVARQRMNTDNPGMKRLVRASSRFFAGHDPLAARANDKKKGYYHAYPATSNMKGTENFFKKRGMSEEGESVPSAPETFFVHHKDGSRVGGPYKSKQRARRAVDKFDNAYGGYAHHIRDNTGKTRF